MCSLSQILLSAFLIGCICGVRAFTGPALLCWAAAAGWLSVVHSPVAFLGSHIVLAVSFLLALLEIAIDKAPQLPARVESGPLFFRFFSGAFCGAVLAFACHRTVVFALLYGSFGALIGAIVGHWFRKTLMNRLHLPNVLAGFSEETIVILAGIWLLWQR